VQTWSELESSSLSQTGSSSPWQSSAQLIDVYDDLSQHYRARLASLNEESSADGLAARLFHKQYVEVSRKLLKIERQTAVQLRNERRISDELLREVEPELDLSESKFAKRS